MRETRSDPSVIDQLTAGRFIAVLFIAIFPISAFANPPDDLDYEARRKWIIEQFKNVPIRENTKQGIPDALARLKANEGEDERALTYLTHAIPGDANMFDWPGMAAALHMFGDKFTEEQLAKIRSRLTEHARSLLGHGTENHAAMRVASGYLFAKYFPDATWTYHGKKYTSSQLMAEAKKRILRRGRGFYRVGNNEMLSSTYALINATPFVALQQYAEDPEVRKAAEALVKFHLAMIALNNFDGHVMPPFNRRNAIQSRFGPTDQPTGHYMPVHHQMSWLLFGQNEVKAEDFTRAAEPCFPLFFTIADWRPPNRSSALPTVPVPRTPHAGHSGGIHISAVAPPGAAQGSMPRSATSGATGSSPLVARSPNASIRSASTSTTACLPLCGSRRTASGSLKPTTLTGAATPGHPCGKVPIRRSSKWGSKKTPPLSYIIFRKKIHGPSRPGKNIGLTFATIISTVSSGAP